jgi:hypothetical protein
MVLSGQQLYRSVGREYVWLMVLQKCDQNGRNIMFIVVVERSYKKIMLFEKNCFYQEAFFRRLF